MPKRAPHLLGLSKEAIGHYYSTCETFSWTDDRVPDCKLYTRSSSSRSSSKIVLSQGGTPHTLNIGNYGTIKITVDPQVQEQVRGCSVAWFKGNEDRIGTEEFKDEWLNEELELSHTCGNTSCISTEHLCMEPHEFNISRKVCHGLRYNIKCANCSSELSTCPHLPPCINYSSGKSRLGVLVQAAESPDAIRVKELEAVRAQNELELEQLREQLRLATPQGQQQQQQQANITPAVPEVAHHQPAEAAEQHSYSQLGEENLTQDEKEAHDALQQLYSPAGMRHLEKYPPSALENLVEHFKWASENIKMLDDYEQHEHSRASSPESEDPVAGTSTAATAGSLQGISAAAAAAAAAVEPPTAQPVTSHTAWESTHTSALRIASLLSPRKKPKHE